MVDWFVGFLLFTHCEGSLNVPTRSLRALTSLFSNSNSHRVNKNQS